MGKLRFGSLSELLENDNFKPRRYAGPVGKIRPGKLCEDGYGNKIEIMGWSESESGFCGMDSNGFISVYSSEGKCLIKKNGKRNKSKSVRRKDGEGVAEISEIQRDGKLDLIV